ncbi:Xylan glycosyltransferase MUCI21 [Linum perenne]
MGCHVTHFAEVADFRPIIITHITNSVTQSILKLNPILLFLLPPPSTLHLLHSNPSPPHPNRHSNPSPPHPNAAAHLRRPSPPPPPLSINPALDFHNLLDRAYAPRIKAIIEDEQLQQQQQQEASSGIPNFRQLEQQNPNIPKLVIVSRNGSRSITNEDALIKLAEKIGFRVEVLRPDQTTELAKIYRSMNSSDVVIGVHGAAMAHFLFMRPGCGFIQVVPLGTEWAADSYYGEPARKMGLKYIGYIILPKESSLYEKYEKDDPVLRRRWSCGSGGGEWRRRWAAAFGCGGDGFEWRRWRVEGGGRRKRRIGLSFRIDWVTELVIWVMMIGRKSATSAK